MAAPTRMLLPYRSGLVGYWPLCEGGGIIAHDLSPMGNHGTLLPPASEPTWTAGKLGKALSFDVINDCVDISPTPLQTPTEFTVSTWVKVLSLGASDVSIIGDWDAANVNFMIRLSAVGVVRPHLQTNPTGWLIFDSNTQLALDIYYHLVVTWEQPNLKLYINTVEDANSPASRDEPKKNNDPSLRIGTDKTSGAGVNAIIDEVCIFNRALTAGEVLDEYFSAVRGW